MGRPNKKEEERMSSREQVIQTLESEVSRIQSAISILRGMDGGKASVSSSGRRNLSPDARGRISEAAKKRWARHRRQKLSRKAA